MNEKGRQTKLLAAIAIIAMVVCALAVVIPSGQVDAVDDSASANEARIGDVSYSTFELAVDAAVDGDTIEILADVTVKDCVDLGKTITIELNNHTIHTTSETSGMLINVDQESDVTINGPGTLSNTCAVANGVLTVNAGSSLKVNNVTVDGKGYGIYVEGYLTADRYSGGVLVEPATHPELRDETITDDSEFATYFYLNDSTLNTITMPAIGTNGMYGYEYIEVNDSNLNTTEYTAMYIPSNAKVIVNNTTIKASSGIDQRAGYLEVNNSSITYTGAGQDKETGDGPTDFGVGISVIDAKGYSTADAVTVVNNVTFTGNEGGTGDIVMGVSRNNSESTDVDDILSSTSMANRNGFLSIDGMEFTTNADDEIGVSYMDDGNINVGKASTLVITENVVLGDGKKLTIAEDASAYVIKGASISGGNTNEIADSITDFNNAEGSQTITDGSELAILDGSGANLTISGTVDISEDINLTNGTTLTITGTIEIAEGVNFTVGNDAQVVVNNGWINSDGLINGRVIFHNNSSETTTLGAEERSISFEDFVGSIKFSSADDKVSIVDAKSGTLTIVSGTAYIDASLTEIPVGVTLNIQRNVTLILNGDSLEVNGTLNQYGRIVGVTGSGTEITVNKEGVFNAMSGATFSNITVAGDGTINMSGAMNDATLTGVYSTTTTFALNQNMVVSGTLTVTGQATLYINGGLEIPEGTTVYIEEGSKIIVQGGVAEVVIDGTLNVYETGAFNVDGSKSVEISGTIISEESSTISITGSTELTGNASITAMGSFTANNGLEIGADATLNLQGAASINGTQNSGTIVFDGATVSTTRTTIQMTGNGATVNIISVQLTNGGSLSVSDSALNVTNATVENDNAITFTTGNGNVAVEGVTITESFQTETRNGQTYVDNSLAASGNMAVDRGDDTDAFGNVTFEGANVRVIDTLNIDENIMVSVSSAGTELFVDGTMTMADGVVMQLHGGAEVTVNGQISSYEEIVGTSINAVYYRATAEPRNVYTNLADAVANNSASTTVVTLEVMGTVIVSESVQVPATVNINGTGTLQIGAADNRGITVDIADGCDVRADAVVFATLHFFNDRNDRGDVVSDVTIENGNEITYTNVATALAGAQPGDVVTITGTDVTITSDLTVPAEVTLVVPLGSIVTVEDNVTVTVNGTINTQTGLAAANEFGERADDDTSRLIVNGTFMTTESGELSALWAFKASWKLSKTGRRALKTDSLALRTLNSKSFSARLRILATSISNFSQRLSAARALVCNLTTKPSFSSSWRRSSSTSLWASSRTLASS